MNFQYLLFYGVIHRVIWLLWCYCDLFAHMLAGLGHVFTCSNACYLLAHMFLNSYKPIQEWTVTPECLQLFLFAKCMKWLKICHFTLFSSVEACSPWEYCALLYVLYAVWDAHWTYLCVPKRVIGHSIKLLCEQRILCLWLFWWQLLSRQAPGLRVACDIVF